MTTGPAIILVLAATSRDGTGSATGRSGPFAADAG